VSIHHNPDPRACADCPVGTAWCVGFDDRAYCPEVISAWAEAPDGGHKPRQPGEKRDRHSWVPPEDDAPARAMAAVPVAESLAALERGRACPYRVPVDDPQCNCWGTCTAGKSRRPLGRVAQIECIQCQLEGGPDAPSPA